MRAVALCLATLACAACVAAAENLAEGELSRMDPPGADMGDDAVEEPRTARGAELKERRDEEEATREGKRETRVKASQLGEGSLPDPQQAAANAATEGAADGDQQQERGNGAGGRGAQGQGVFEDSLRINADKQTLRVGAVWGMPGLYSSDGAARDLVLGTAGGKRVYFGTGRNDAWIEATTGHMWLKGSITVKNYAHFFAEKQRLRVGAAWGMPGIYASDGADRDMIIGTAAGKKIYFGVHRQDAWIQAGEGHMWLRGSLTVKNYGHFFADGQRLRVGAAFGMPGIYASDGEDRDMMIGTASGKKIYFGLRTEDAWIQAGAGDMFLKGGLQAGANSIFKDSGKTLRVGSSYNMPGIYAGDGGADDLSLGTLSGRKIYFGVNKDDAFIQAGTGSMFLKGSLTTQSDMFIESNNNKLRVGSVNGLPGLYSSDGEARDLMLGAETGRKIFFGKTKDEAWMQAGTGDMMLKGILNVQKSIKIDTLGQSLRVGEFAGMPGLYSSDGTARDLILGAAANSKIYVGEGTTDSYFTAGLGNLWLKGSLESHDNVYVYSESQRLRVGSIDGIPGLYSSDGQPRDLALATAKNSKVFFGDGREDAWVQAGTGDSFFKGSMEVSNSIQVSKNGQTLLVGEAFGMPGIYSSTGAASDLMLGVASGKKVHLGYGSGDAYIVAGTGNAWFKGTLTAANEIIAEKTLRVKKAATFDDTVTVTKNLILSSSAGMMDLTEELMAMRSENSELRAMMSEMRSQMTELMASR